MPTVIQGGTVVAFDGTGHRLLRDGLVVFEGSTVAHVGRTYDGPRTAVLDARERLILPGFVNLHFHATGEAGGRLISDVGRRDFFQTGYLNYLATTEERARFLDRGIAEVGGRLALVEVLRSGCTTAVEMGGESDYEGLLRVAGELGLRLYLAPGFRSGAHRVKKDGGLTFSWDEAGGFEGLKRARAFIERHQGSFGDRIRGILIPLQVDTCSPELLRETGRTAEELRVPVQIHTAQNLMEFHEILRRHGKTPIELLEGVRLLGPRTILGHCVMTSAHPFTVYPGGRDLEIIARSGSSVAHCPLVFARRGNALHSFDRYRRAGITVGLGTDTYPRDMIAEMRLASYLGKVADHEFAAATARDLFNAATLEGAKALGRPDLGRLAPGAKADIVIVNLSKVRIGPHRDPIRALVNCATMDDVETVIVDGKTVVQGGRVVGLDEGDLLRRAQEEAEVAWSKVSSWHWDGLSADEFSPPSFPWT